MLVNHATRKKLAELPKAFPADPDFGRSEEGTDLLDHTAAKFAGGKGVLAVWPEMSDREIGSLVRIAMGWAAGKPFEIKQWGRF